MGEAVNNKSGLQLNDDYKKQVVHARGFHKNLQNVHWKNLTAADQFEIKATFNKFSQKEIEETWNKIKSKM